MHNTPIFKPKSMKFGKHMPEYCLLPKISDARKSCCNQRKIQTKMPNLMVFQQKDANGKANSEDRDQTALEGLGLHYLPRPICRKI